MKNMYSFVCKNLILPLADIATGRSIHKKYLFLKEAQYWQLDKLKDYQNNKLQQVIKFAYESVPYYRKIFNERGLKPADIKTTDDLIKLPILTKKIIRENGVDDFVYGKKEKLIKETTSGSSGEQGTVYLSKEAQSLTYAAELLLFEWGGFSLGERHLQSGINLHRGVEKGFKDFIFNCSYVPALDFSDKHLGNICNLLTKKKIKTFLGYPLLLYYLAKYAEKRRMKIKFDSIISLGDMLYPNQREAVEKAFRCKINDTYGCAEGFQIAAQCEHQEYHICMPLTFVEIIDKDGNRADNGEIGRVVLTRLDFSPMPLIRYEVGDLAALSNKKKCKCGRSFILLDSIAGRDTDVVTTSSGHRLTHYYFVAALEHDESIRQFQVLQNSKGEILMKIVPGKGFEDGVLDKIRRRISKDCDNELKIKFEIVDRIPETKSGKRRFVISSIK